jgi:cell division protein FtsW
MPPNVDSHSIKQPKYKLGKPDRLLLLVIGLLLAMGLLSVYSASATHAQVVFGNSFGYVIRQAIAMAIGLAIGFGIACVHPHKWLKLTLPFAIVVIGLLAYTLVGGTVANGSERWISVPVIGQFQPSELAKIAAVLLLAQATGQAKRLTWQHGLNIGLVLVMVGLIYKQPNLSMTIILTALTGAMLYVSRWPWPLFVVGAPLAGWFVYQKILETPYQLRRISGWLNPWEDAQDTGYNLVQSYYAIGSGGLIGMGYGQSVQKQFYLPFPYTDFIFSVICEEWGLLGSIMLVGVFAILAWRGIRVALLAPTLFTKQLAFGLTFVLTLQTIINISVTTGLMPVTGVTLPMVSYGGTSMVATLAMLGMLVGVSRLTASPASIGIGQNDTAPRRFSSSPQPV